MNKKRIAIVSLILLSIPSIAAYHQYPVISNASIKVLYVNFGGPFPNTGCSSDPCTINNQSGGISAVNRTGTGDYIVHFGAAFTDLPSCTFSISSDTNSNPSARSPTTTQVNVHNNNGTANFDAAGSVVCVGKR